MFISPSHGGSYGFAMTMATMALGHPPRLGAQVAVHRSPANAAGRRSMRHRRAPHRIRSDLVSPGLRECQKMGRLFCSIRKNHGFHLGVELMVWNMSQQRGWDWSLILWEVCKFLVGEAIKARKPGEKPPSWPSWVQLNKWMAGRSWSSPDFWVPGSTHW